MTFVVSFIDYRPPPRFDTLAWTGVDINEGASSAGPWTTLETQTFGTPDPDPTQPLRRDLTTTLATAPSGLWYQVVFRDAAGRLQPTVPEFNSAAAPAVPTSDEIRLWSDVPFEEVGYADIPNTADKLERVIARACAEFRSLSGIDPTTITADDRRTPLIQEVLQRLTEYKVLGGRIEVLETAADFDLIASFSAGGYSETRRNAGFARNQRHPWPVVHRLLDLIDFFDFGGSRPAEVPVVGHLEEAYQADWGFARYILDSRRYRGSTVWPDIYRPPWIGGGFPA